MLKVALLIVVLGTGSSFIPSPLTRSRLSSSLKAISEPVSSEDTLFRAVEYAESKECDLEECDRLATELENLEGCKFEVEDGVVCDKEIQDRLDVAQILRLKIELQLRLDYLKNANVFAEDVRKEHDALERQKFKEALIENREKGAGGSDLGLW